MERTWRILTCTLALSMGCGDDSSATNPDSGGPDGAPATDAAQDVSDDGGPLDASDMDAVQRHDATVDLDAGIDHDATIDHDAAIDHDGATDRDGAIDHDATIDHDGAIDRDGAIDHDASVPPTGEELANPRPGEWPMFKRDLGHTGLAADMAGRITASNVCLRWSRRVTADNTRGASGALIAVTGGVPTVYIAPEGTCEGTTCTIAAPGSVYALRGSDGAILWHTRLPGASQTDPYAPLIADVDADGRREIVVPSTNDRNVFALRAEAEGSDPAGSIQWRFEFDERDATSEAAPAAANFDPSDPALEIVLGTGLLATPTPSASRARFYAIDGATGTRDGDAFSAPLRTDLDARCVGGEKMDSSSPAVGIVGGRPVAYVGSWLGRLYALEWRTDPRPGLYNVWSDVLPTYAGGPTDCTIRKIRNGPAVAQIVPGGDPEVVFGYMVELPTAATYETPILRMLDANGLALLGEVDVHDWKSSPSVADLDRDLPGLEITAGRYRGFYSAGPGATGGLARRWDVDLGDGDGLAGGNRASPALADTDGDGQLEAIAVVEGDVTPEIVCYDGRTGMREWTYPLGPRGGQSAPAVGDIDGDGELEIVALGFDGVLYALDSACP